MNKNLIVALASPIFEPNGGDGGGKTVNLGTGYPVAEDLILTARHVVSPPGRDARYPLKVRWWYSNLEGWIDVPLDAVEWVGEGKVDAALVRCRRPTDVRGFGILSEERPVTGMRWESEGFPQADKYDGVRHPSSFGGEVFSKADAEALFEISAILKNPETVEGWCGASGMPVCVAQKILGVVAEVPQNYGARTLHAVPAWQLLRVDRFRELVGYDHQLEHRSQFRSSLLAILDGSTVAVDRLIPALNDPNPIVGASAKDRAEAVVDRLLAMNIDQAIILLHDVHEEIEVEASLRASDELGHQTQIIARAARLLVPALFDLGVVRWMHDQQGDPTAAWIELPAYLPTVAEVIMASVDQREARFRGRADDQDYPEGEFCLPNAPEFGIDDGALQRIDAVRDHLAKKFSPIVAKSFRQGIDDLLIGHYYRPRANAPERTLKQKIVLAADAMALARQQRQRRSYYMIVNVPLDNAGRSALEAMVRQLKADYKAITFLALTDDYEIERQERNRFARFCQMLPTK